MQTTVCKEMNSAKTPLLPTTTAYSWFGGTNGITYFNPQEITNPAKKWNVRIIDFYLHDQPIRKGMLSGGKEIINTSVFEARDFHLSHNDNAFSIEFSTRELNNSERITYLYTINNTPWVKLPKGVNRVSFSDLPPAIIISGSKPKIICWNPTPMKSPFTSHRHGGHRAGPC